MSRSHADIVFVFPPASGHAGRFAPHLGAAYLRAALAEHGIKSSQYIDAHPGTVAKVARDLLAQRSALIGFTAYDANFPLCLAIARAIKQQRPAMKIVFGGPTVTFGARELLSRHQTIDLCMLSESEETAPRVLGDLCNCLFPDQNQLGVAFRKEGTVICAADPPLVAESAQSMQSALDVTPSPYLSGMLPDGRTGLLTGRGCTHHCQYCCFAALGRRKVRLHSLERVLAELEFIAAHQRRTGQRYVVPIQDDTFALLPARAKRLCEMIIGRRLKLTLSCATRADTADEELLRLMRSAGFASIAFGLESAVPSVLRAIGKVRPPDWPERDLAPERRFIEQVRESVVGAKKLGFKVGVSIILGLPWETAADARETLRFVNSLPVDYYAHNFLRLSCGAPLWYTKARHGLRCSLDELGLPAKTQHAYDVRSLRPGSKCGLKREAELVRTIAADAISDCEAASADADGVRTVLVHAPELTPKTAEWLHAVLAVGGAVLHVYPRLRCQHDDQIQLDRSIFAAHLVPARYYIQMEQQRTRAGSNRYLIACSDIDLYRRHSPHLVSFMFSENASPMLAWLRGLSNACEVCDASPALLRSRELAALAREIECGSGCSAFQEMPIPPRIRYAGRWLKDTVSCRSLSRLEVDAEDRVRCCPFGSPLGKVGDKKDQLLMQLKKMTRAAARRRGCHQCKNTECPRCPFPGVDDETYCRTIAQCAPASKTLGLMWLFSQLPSAVAHQQEGS